MIIEELYEIVNRHYYVLITLSLIVFVIVYYFGPFRALILRKKVLIEPILDDDRKEVAVMLIHGTFARNAPWTEAGHKFTIGIRKALNDCNIVRLLWSGDNSHKIRLNSAIHVAQWISNQSANQIYLIGHSHGGNIAAIAASIANDNRVQVITMSTPFISLSPRYIGFISRRKGIQQIDDEKRLLLGIIIYTMVGILKTLFGIDIGLSLIWALLLLALLFGLDALFSGGVEKITNALIFLIKKKSLRSCDAASLNLQNNTLTIFRTQGDEASGALTVGQFLSWVVFAIFNIIGILMDIISCIEIAVISLINKHKKLLLVLPFFCFILPFALTSKEYADNLLSIEFGENLTRIIAPIVGVYYGIVLVLFFRLISLLLEPIFSVIASLITIICYMPFGLGLALAGPFISVTVESAPLGSWRINTINNSDTFIAHSLLYDTDIVPEYLSTNRLKNQ